jgi:hypothetical protein
MAHRLTLRMGESVEQAGVDVGWKRHGADPTAPRRLCGKHDACPEKSTWCTCICAAQVFHRHGFGFCQLTRGSTFPTPQTRTCRAPRRGVILTRLPQFQQDPKKFEKNNLLGWFSLATPIGWGRIGFRRLVDQFGRLPRLHRKFSDLSGLSSRSATLTRYSRRPFEVNSGVNPQQCGRSQTCIRGRSVQMRSIGPDEASRREQSANPSDRLGRA